MAFTTAQLAASVSAQIDFFVKNKPVDQINKARPLFNFLVQNKVNRIGGQQNVVEQIRKSNDSNAQNYFGDDQVSYNKKDTLAQAKYPWYNIHDGFTMNEDEASQNGITLTDDRMAEPSRSEMVQLTNIITERLETLDMGLEEALDIEFHLNGAQNSKAVPGLDFLVSTTPTVGVVGSIDAATSAYWRNNSSLNIAATAGTLIAAMEAQWRACMLYGGGSVPNKILASQLFIDAYAKDVRSQPGQTVWQTGPSKGGVALDGSRSGVWFKGVEVEWDPTLDILDALVGTPTIPYAKRAYFLNSKTIKLRPVEGRWMIKRTPDRVYDRYSHFWGMTASYSMTTNRRNANSVLSIA